MKNRGQKLASYSHTFYSQSAEGVALLYSASSFKKTMLWYDTVLFRMCSLNKISFRVVFSKCNLGNSIKL